MCSVNKKLNTNMGYILQSPRHIMFNWGVGHTCSSYLCVVMETCTIFFLPTPDGKIIRIVHANGHTEISNADHWVSLLHIAI